MIAQAPAGGWGVIGQLGIAVNNAIESYGVRCDRQNRYWFENFPNPGGLPTLGNASFSLTMASAPSAPVQSIFGLSLGRGSSTFAGCEILVDPGSLAISIFAGSTSTVVPLPIPNDPAFSGLGLTAQSAHLENGGGFAASRGLDLVVQ